MNLHNMPNLSFAERSPELIESNVIKTVEGLLNRKLARADPLRLFLMGVEVIIVQQRAIIDAAAKMNLLAYAVDDYLDHLGALVGTERIGEASAHTTLKLMLSAPREAATLIPKGMRVTAGDSVMFALDTAVTIPQGEISAFGTATCTMSGVIGNGYKAGELKTIVDPVPFLQSASNTTTTEGGADAEDDESYRERIHEAPEKFSTAGPSLAYAYHAKSASALIADVYAHTPAPGEVDVYVLLRGGIVPGEEIIALVGAKLNDASIRPLTDKVTVKAPAPVTYNIDAVYYIDRRDATEAAAIQKRTESAVQDFVLWQKERLGRDINPTELYYRLREAGVKRAEIKLPVFTKTEKNQVAVADQIKVTFGGLEDE